MLIAGRLIAGIGRGAAQFAVKDGTGPDAAAVAETAPRSARRFTGGAGALRRRNAGAPPAEGMARGARRERGKRDG
jgi:hypothetical protein